MASYILLKRHMFLWNSSTFTCTSPSTKNFILFRSCTKYQGQLIGDIPHLCYIFGQKINVFPMQEVDEYHPQYSIPQWLGLQFTTSHSSHFSSHSTHKDTSIRWYQCWMHIWQVRHASFDNLNEEHVCFEISMWSKVISQNPDTYCAL